LERFIATVIICKLTGLIVVITEQYLKTPDLTGAPLVSKAFASVFPFFPTLLAVVIILFALSTLISWSYYGIKAWSFMFGEGLVATRIFQVIFCIVIVIGSSMNMRSVVDFTDAMMFAMAVPNLIAIYIMMPVILKELKTYCKKYNVGIYREITSSADTTNADETKQEVTSVK
ncbi:MAG: alanine:cation symporter family protein, partial [Candidatus Gastranaerophilales bacterium]|nr:alanine:cation symporter family protein [Candidatus Gastranaerophilales bacterium]